MTDPLQATDVDLPVIALPGTLCDGRVFAPALTRLGWDYEVADTGAASCARDVADQILAQAPPRFVLVAFSMGGFVALDLALQAPERVVAMVLIGANARSDPPTSAQARWAQYAMACSEGYEAVIRAGWPRMVGAAKQGDTRLQDLLVDMARLYPLDRFERQTRVAASRPDQRPSLGQINAPCLVVHGDEDALCPLDRQQELVQGLGRAWRVPLVGAGHFAPLESDAALAGAMAAWAADVGLEP